MGRGGKRRRVFALAATTWLTALANSTLSQERPVQPGDPLTGITPAEFTAFRLGLDDFLEVETAEEGLGPAFNGASCAVCHNLPAIGGSGVLTEVRAGRREADGTFRDLTVAGGSLFHMFSVPTHGCQPSIPEEANVIARRAPIPLFGAGLVEAIPDDTLLALADPDDRDRDGVSGRAAIVIDLESGESRVGRFGWKSQHATLLVFGADAYRNEMGITNDIFPLEAAHGVGPEQIRLCDPFPDPEDRIDPATGRRGIDNFETFMKFLAPVARGPIDDEVRAGEQVFAAVGCSKCHVPALQTGRTGPPMFRNRQVPLFSDLLLHDIGTRDGIVQGAAAANEIRTPALWGLRFRRPLMHDGSAATIADAILQHRGEALLAYEGFVRLRDADRSLLMKFLRSL
jgi:CxxC motif-containing protein (DUF1111 family)